MDISSSYVPAHLLYTSAGETQDTAKETLNRKGNTYKCQTVSASFQTELQVSGE